MDLKKIEKVVGSIQTQLFKNSNSFSVGMFKSKFRGSGIQFKEHQVYNHGDDVRFIDWKLSAKSSRTYVKTFEEERNVEVVIFIDMDKSMYIGYDHVSKLQAALELTCLIYLLTKETHDVVRVVLFGEEIYTLPVKSGREGIILLVSLLEKIGVIDANGNIDYTKELKKTVPEKTKLSLIKNYVAKRKEVVLFLDFNNLEEEKEINKVLSKENVHAFKIISPLEGDEKIPFTVFIEDHFKSGSGFIFKNSGGDSKESVIKGRVKELNVKDRYLDTFIREMI